MARSSGWDPLVVSTRDLAAVVNSWVRSQDYDGDYEPERGVMDPLAWIAQYCGIHKRAVERVTNCETKFTTFSLADDLLMAIGRPDLMPEVVANPMWNREKWEEWRRTCYE